MACSTALPQNKLIERARELAPRWRERSERAEKLRRAPDESIAELVDAMFPRITQPARFGGLELGLDSICAVSMELAKGCASQAWVSNVFSEHAGTVALFSDEAQHEVWDANPKALVSSSYSPSGKVSKVAGGIRVTGRYHFSSGVHHAHWTFIGGMLARDGAPPLPILALIPAHERRIIDNWHAVGMAGTGSCDIEFDNVFVPEHRVLDESLVFEGKTPGSLVNKAPVYRMPQRGIAQLALASVPVGAAEGAVEDFAQTMQSKIVRGQRMAESEALQLRLAESAAEVESARRLILGTARQVMDKLSTGAYTDSADMAHASRNAAYGAKLAQQAVSRLFEAAGGGGILLDNQLQRTFRDIHAAGGHIGLAWDRNAVMYSRERVGLGIKGFFPGR
ncbi:MAG: acyl-CoA dehydrogenase family protein [Burkholderiales bacterium]